MRNRILLVSAIWLFSVPSLFAQYVPPPPTPVQPDPGVARFPPDPRPAVAAPAPDTFRFWVRAEYLGWWVKNTPAPISILTGDPANPNVELLNSDRSFGMFSGFRIGLGGWLDPNGNLGMEANYFFLNRRSRRLIASSDETGNPTLAYSFFSQDPGTIGENLLFISSPGVFGGTVAVTSSLQLLGAEVNGLFSLWRQNNGFEVTGLVGFRYLNLRETLDIDTFSSALTTNPTTDLFMHDAFATRNEFYGGQVGVRVAWQGDYLGADVTGKLGIGATRQTIDVQGFSTQMGPGGPNGVFPGGFYTQPSNIGRTTANQFSLIPAIEAKFFVQITQHLRIFVGYDFLYWNRVVRPGNQVDRNINLTQSVALGGGALNGQASPMPLLNRSDFWTQGVNVGLEIRY